MTPSRSGAATPRAAQSAALPVLDLDALVRPIGRVKRFKVEHDVMPIDGVSMNIFEQLREQAGKGETLQPGTEMELTRKILHQIIPTMSEEHLHALAVEEMLQIIMMARISVDRVRDFIRSQERSGKAPRPAHPGRARARSK